MKLLPLLFLLISPLAMAAPIPVTVGGFSDSGDELFTPTDLDHNADTSTFILTLETGSHNTGDHEFGIYQYDSVNDVVGQTLAVLNDTYTSQFGYDVLFDLTAETVTSSLGTSLGQSIDLSLTSGLQFGFYFTSDGDTFYSQAQFNPGGEDLFGLYWNPDVLSTPDLWVFASDNDVPADLVDTYTVAINDVSPIPEPSILALFGLGLAGLGFTARKKK